MRLLVVDDDAVFREELAELLRDDRHDVEVAPSVAKALEALARAEFDVVLTDLKMPRQGGLDLLREVRARYPATFVVMVTGHATVETAVTALQAGAAEYIQKPFRLDRIREVLQRVEQEARYVPGRGVSPDPDALVRVWARDASRPILHLTTRTPRPVPGVTVAAPDLEDPSAIRAQVEAFLADRPRAAVLLEGIDRLLAHHRRGDIVAFLGDLQHRLEGRGPFVVTFDPARISVASAREVRAAVAGSATRLTLEALANPVRRAVLRRAAEGPCSFSEALRAAGLEESPKLAFHLRRLLDDELLGHEGEEYRITPKGRQAVAWLDEVEALERPGATSGGALPFPGASPA